MLTTSKNHDLIYVLDVQTNLFALEHHKRTKNLQPVENAFALLNS